MAEESRNVGSRVIVIEPGWVVVHFTAPPEASERLSFLNRTLEDWFRDHPDCKLESVHPVESGGVLRGLNAYYHMEVRREGTLKLRVDAALLGQYGQEYIEAVVSEAIPQWTRPTLPANTFAIVNRRHVAISPPTGLFSGGTQRTAWVIRQSTSSRPSSGDAR